MLIREYSQDVLLETKSRRSRVDAIMDVELCKEMICIETQKYLRSPPSSDTEPPLSISGQLGIEAICPVILETNDAERDVEVNGRSPSTCKDRLSPSSTTHWQWSVKSSLEIEDAQQMNDIFVDNDLADLPSLMVLPLQQHELMSQYQTSTVSTSIIVIECPDLPRILEPRVHLGPQLPPEFSWCVFYRIRCPMSSVKCESKISGLCRQDLLLNRLRGGGDSKFRISDKAVEDSFTILPRFRPYVQFPESAVRSGLGSGIELNAGSDGDHPSDTHDDIAGQSMAGITRLAENTLFGDMVWDRSQPAIARSAPVRTTWDTGDAGKRSMAGIDRSGNTSNRNVEMWDSSPPAIEPSTPIRTASCDTGEVDKRSTAGIAPSRRPTSYIDVETWDSSPPDMVRATLVRTASHNAGEVVEQSMAGVNSLRLNKSYIDVETWDSSPPDMTRATSARTESRDTGAIKEHTRLGDDADNHNDRPNKAVAQAQQAVKNSTHRYPGPNFFADFQDIAYQQAQPSHPYKGLENVELQSQRPPIASTPNYMIPPANAVGPPLRLEDAACRGRQYGSAPSFYDAVYSDTVQLVPGPTAMLLRLNLPPLRNQDYNPMLDRSPTATQLQQVVSGPLDSGKQYHKPVVEKEDVVPFTSQRNIRPGVPQPHHHTSYPISSATTPNISNSILPYLTIIDPSTGACAGPRLCMLPPPHAHYTPQNIFPKPLTIGELVNFATAQPGIPVSNPQTHALAARLSTWQQNAAHASLAPQLQGRTLPVPQNTALIAQLGAAPFVLRQQWLLRSHVVEPQTRSRLTPYQSALSPQIYSSGVYPQGRTQGRSRGRGCDRVIESRDLPFPRMIGHFNRDLGIMNGFTSVNNPRDSGIRAREAVSSGEET